MPTVHGRIACVRCPTARPTALSYESTAFVPVGAAGCVGLRELPPTMSKAAFAEVQKKLVDTQKQYHPPWVIMD
jgi:hypothetical protein